jgi:endonuclease YncB( thermonuclease family)
MNRAVTALFCVVLLNLNGSACGDALGPGLEQEFSARVIVVLDGDTVLILHKATGQRAGGLMKIRLAEIDAPEVGHAGMGGQPPNSQKAQSFGAASRSSLVEMVLHKQIQVRPLALDKYGRTIAQLEVNGLSVNEEMVRRGMAWEYSHYHSDRRYIVLENEARQAGRGLWAQVDPIPPWQWRKQHTAVTEMSVVLAPGDYTCGSKHHCSQMRSCDEAHYYLTICGVKTLNPKGDGIPCEKLCAGGK